MVVLVGGKVSLLSLHVSGRYGWATRTIGAVDPARRVELERGGRTARMTADDSRPLFQINAANEVEVDSGVKDRPLILWGWMESHSENQPVPGPHIAIHGRAQDDGEWRSLVVHLERVPALVAALTEAA